MVQKWIPKSQIIRKEETPKGDNECLTDNKGFISVRGSKKKNAALSRTKLVSSSRFDAPGEVEDSGGTEMIVMEQLNNVIVPLAG